MPSSVSLNRPVQLQLRTSTAKPALSKPSRPLQEQLSVVAPKEKPRAASGAAGKDKPGATVKHKKDLSIELKSARSLKNLQLISSNVSAFAKKNEFAPALYTQPEQQVAELTLLKQQISQARDGLTAYKGSMHTQKSTQLNAAETFVDTKLDAFNAATKLRVEQRQVKASELAQSKAAKAQFKTDCQAATQKLEQIEGALKTYTESSYGGRHGDVTRSYQALPLNVEKLGPQVAKFIADPQTTASVALQSYERAVERYLAQAEQERYEQTHRRQ